MASIKEELIKDVSVFSGGALFGKIVLVLRGIITAKFLGPSMYGLWNALTLILTYAAHLHLGTLNALNKEVPYYRAKGNLSKADEIRNTVLSFTGINGAIVGIILFAISFFLDAPLPIIIGIRVVAFIVFLQLIEYFYYILLQTEKKFVLIGKFTLLYSVVAVLLIAPLVIIYGIYGFFAAVLIMPVLSILFYIRQTDYRFKFYFNFAEIKRLIKLGFPILSMILMYGVFRSIDRIMILSFLDRVQLGYYGIAIMVSNFLFLAPGSIADAISPRIFEKLGKTENIKDIGVYLIKPTIIQSYLISVLTGLAVIAAEFMLRTFLAEYIISFNSVIILSFGTFFISIPLISWSYLVALDKQRRALPLFAISILLAISLSYLFIKVGMGIAGVAIGITASYFFYGTCLLGYCLSFCLVGSKEIIKFFIKIYLPLLYTLAIILALNSIFIRIPMIYKTVILCITLKTTIFLILSSPLFFSINRNTGVFSTFWTLVKRKSSLFNMANKNR